MENNFIFGSELKVFKHITKIDHKISRESLNLFLRFAYVPGPQSIYNNIFKLPPGSLLKISRADLKSEYYLVESNKQLPEETIESQDLQISIDPPKILIDATVYLLQQ